MTPDNISKFADHAHVIIPLNEALRNDARKIRLTAAAVGAERTAAPKANVEADQTIQCGEQRPLDRNLQLQNAERLVAAVQSIWPGARLVTDAAFVRNR